MNDIAELFLDVADPGDSQLIGSICQWLKFMISRTEQQGSLRAG